MRAGKHGGRPLAALLAMVIGLVVPILLAVQAAGPAQASPRNHGGTTYQRNEVPCTPAVATSDPYPYSKDITATIDGISPTVISSTSGNLLSVTGTITNNTGGPVYDLRYVFQRGDALSTIAAVKAEIATPSRPDAVVGQDWQVLGPTAAISSTPTQVTLLAKTSLRFIATVPISSADGLIVANRGVYPVMIKVSGDVGTNGCVQYERVGEFHLLATVLSVPTHAQTAPAGAASVTSGPAGSGAAGTTGSGGPSTASESHSSSSDATNGSPPAAPDSAAASTDIPTRGIPTVSAAAESAPSGAAPSGAAPSGAAPSGSAPSGSGTGPVTTTPPTPPTNTGPDAPAPLLPTPLNMIWPIVDSPHVGVSGVFLDDNLAAEISPGGRLAIVLSALRRVDPATLATTIVVDPELLAEIQQMSTGYRVLSTVGPAQAALTAAVPSPSSTAVTTPRTTTKVIPSTSSSAALPRTPARLAPPTPSTEVSKPSAPTRSTKTLTSTATTATPSTPTAVPATPATPATPTPTTTTSETVLAPPDPTVAGRGQAAAISYLAALRTAITGHQVLVLPYSDPDAVAMVRAGLSKQLSSLIAQGRQIAEKILGLATITAPGQPGLITTMSMPTGGLVDDATLAVLSNNGISSAVLSPRSLHHSGGAVGAVTIDEAGNGGLPIDAAVTDADVLAMVNTVISKDRSAGLAVRLNTLAAVLTGGNFDGSATPLILTQSNRWTPDVTGLQVLTGLLRTMTAGGVLAGTSLPAIAGMAKTASTVAYPDGAQQDELDPNYLASVGRDDLWLNGVRASLAQAPAQAKGISTLDPDDLLEPLSTAMATTMSVAFRSDGRIGRDILATTESTLRPLRDQVKIATGTSYTLAASTSPLLINVRNDLPYVVTVRVVIRNAQSVGLTATDPGPLSIPAGQSRQFKIATKVVKAGKFPVQVELLAADGSSWSDPSVITVRSSAYGALTVILIIVAGGALFLMVALRIVQRIRGRNRTVDEVDKRGNLALAGNPAKPETSTEDPVDSPGNAPHGTQDSEGEGKR